MSNLNKKDFASLCGMTTNKLSVYIKRNKVIIDKNGFFDTNNELNSLFIKKNNIEKPIENSETEQTGTQKKEENTSSTANKRDSLLDLEKEKKVADIKKLEIETRISLLKEEKLMGSAMPIEMVKTIISTLSKSFIGEFKNGADEIIRMLVKTKSYDHKEVAEIRGQLSKIINSAMSKSLSTAKKDMKVISENYSETSGVGEHD